MSGIDAPRLRAFRRQSARTCSMKGRVSRREAINALEDVNLATSRPLWTNGPPVLRSDRNQIQGTERTCAYIAGHTPQPTGWWEMSATKSPWVYSFLLETRTEARPGGAGFLSGPSRVFF